MSDLAPLEVQPPTKRRRSHEIQKSSESYDGERDVPGKEEGKPGVQQQHGLSSGVDGQHQDEEFEILDAVSAVQDELNALEEEEAQKVTQY